MKKDIYEQINISNHSNSSFIHSPQYKISSSSYIVDYK